MFDWNDEELTNIIWGEAGDSDDHIVPYQEHSKNFSDRTKWNQEGTTVKPTERKTAGARTDLNGRTLKSSLNLNSNEGSSTTEFRMCSWPGLSDVSKTDENPLGTEVSNNVAEITKYNSRSDFEAILNKESEILQNSVEGEDQGDFVDYSWANIESFDDLDGMFSNDDPIFGHLSLDNADELWSSSQDVTSSPLKSFPLSGDTPSLELGALNNATDSMPVKLESDQQDNQLFSLSHEKLNNPPLVLQNTDGIGDPVEYPGGKSKPVAKEQVMQTGSDTGRNGTGPNSCVVADNPVTDKEKRQKSLLKGRKLAERSEGKLLQDFYGTWSPAGSSAIKYENHLAQPVLQPSLHTTPREQRQQLQKPETLQYLQMSSSFLAPPPYRSIANSYLPMPLLAQVQSGDLKHQPMLSSHELSPGKANIINEPAAASPKPLTMTPQEKIEKLRRRQQMQAMFAIQKQQQQFNNQKFQENQVQAVDVADLEVEDLSSLRSFNPNSPLEQDDTMTGDSYSVEDTVLYRLQDVIAKLDVRIRLCIRDSLFRLAQSAMERHYACDTSSTNKNSKDETDVVTRVESNSCNRYVSMCDGETETNPIDRTVAHMLFHRPLEQSGKNSDTPESPASSKFPQENTAMGLSNFQMGFTAESSKITKNHSREDPCPVPGLQEVDQLNKSSCVGTLENTSNYGAAESADAANVEASR